LSGKTPTLDFNNTESEKRWLMMPINEQAVATGSAPQEEERTEQSAANLSNAQLDGQDAGAGNIDKIRDILFGVQMRDYEKRFTRLEERLLKESSSLRDETKRRFDSLETYIKQELEALTERLTAEQTTRADAAEKLSQNIRDLSGSVEKRAAQIDEQASKNHRELRQQILEQSKSLNDEIRHKYEDLSAALAREASELRTDKTDRAALAALFTEVAMRLNNEFKIPGAE
jgi:DNA anti-recombination protein RmuC